MTGSSWKKHLEDIWRTRGMCILRDPAYAVLRYLMTGAWNTLFGIGIYTLLYGLWGDQVHYLVLGIPANILSISNAFICYKFFVFRTKGNILREYLKCYAVYGCGSLAGMILLVLLVQGLGMHPVAANILGTVIIIAFSYFGHKHFSFRSGRKSGHAA